MIRDYSAVQNTAHNIGLCNADNLHFNQSVVNQNPVADIHIIHQILIRNRYPVLISQDIFRHQYECLPFFQLNSSILKITNPNLGTLGIQQESYRKVQLLSDLLHLSDRLPVLLMRSVGKINSGHAHAVQHQIP